MTTWRLSGDSWLSFMGILALGALSFGCRGTMPTFTSEPDSVELEDGNRRFGRTGDQATNSPIKRYELRAGGLLGLTGKDPGKPAEFRIKSDGTIYEPSLGTVLVAGKTIEELNHEIAKQDRGSQKARLFYVPCECYYCVEGEVNAPGPRPNAPQITISDAISAAGGFTKRANTNLVRLVRSDGRSYIIRLTPSRRTGVQDAYVGPGDIIYVKRCGRFVRWP